MVTTVIIIPHARVVVLCIIVGYVVVVGGIANVVFENDWVNFKGIIASVRWIYWVWPPPPVVDASKPGSSKIVGMISIHHLICLVDNREINPFVITAAGIKYFNVTKD